MLGKEASVETIMQEELGYNDPILVQLSRYFKTLLQGIWASVRDRRTESDIFGAYFR
ncbi:MAG: hypothetical protein ACLVJ6_10850 [Merdibacter sp.]